MAHDELAQLGLWVQFGELKSTKDWPEQRNNGDLWGVLWKGRPVPKMAQ